jgi:hypothetical protein
MAVLARRAVMGRRSRLIVLTLSVFLSACALSRGAGGAETSAETSAAEAPTKCQNMAKDDNGTVVAAFASTIGAIRRLPAVANNPQLDTYADAQVATVCYIDGEIPKGPGSPPPPATAPPSYDRAVLVVVGEDAIFVSAGYRDRMPIQAP